MRKELGHLPSLVFVIGLVSGIVAMDWHWILVGFLGALLYLPTLPSRMVLCVGLLFGTLIAPMKPAVVAHRKDVANLPVRVRSVPTVGTNGTSCEVKASRSTFLLFWETGQELSLGDDLLVSGRISAVKEGFEELYYSKRWSGTVNATRIEVIHEGPELFRWGLHWRDGFRAFTEKTLDSRAARAVDALCFNIDRPIDDSMRENLQRTGTTHIISASGLHVLILAVGLQRLLGLLPLPRPVQLLILVAILVIYSAATGFRPPIVRSVVMALILSFAYLFEREGDLLSALSVSAAAYLIWRPESVFDIGFQLSFVTVAGLAMFMPKMPEIEPNLGGVLKAHGLAICRASFVASLASLPLVAYHFGTVSVIGIVANVLIALVIAPIILVAMCSHLIALVFPGFGAGVMSLVVQPLTGWVLAVVEHLGTLPFAAVELPAFHPVWIVIYYCLWMLVWRRREVKL